MVDTPRTDAYLQGTEFAGGQSPGAIGSQQLRDLIISMLNIVPSVVSAAGTTQGTATVLTAQFNIVTVVAASAGVVATAGYTKIWNEGANTLAVYPVSGANFEANSANAAAYIEAGGQGEFVMTSTTQGYMR